MENLPSLVVHGGVLWPLFLVVSVVIGVFAGRVLGRFRAARRARGELSGLGAAKGSLEGSRSGEETVLAGRLSQKGEPWVSLKSGAPIAAVSANGKMAIAGAYKETNIHASAPGLVLEVGDDEVLLQGDIDILSGSRQLRCNLSRGALEPEVSKQLRRKDSETFFACGDYPACFEMVSPGDAVRVAGTLREEAGDEGATDYRHPAVHWELDGGDEGERTPLSLAFDGSPRLQTTRRFRVVRAILNGLLGLSLGAGMIYVTAEAGLRLGEEVADESERYPISLQLVAATWSRDKALGELVNRATRAPRSNRELVSERAALVGLRGGCGREAADLLFSGDFERAASIGENCTEERGGAAAVEALYVFGRFERASELLEERGDLLTIWGRDSLSPRIHLLAGREDLAREALQRLEESLVEQARQMDQEESSRDLEAARRVRDGQHQRVMLARCVSAALEARAGSSESLERLRELVRLTSARGVGPGNSVAVASRWCPLLLSDLLEGEDRIRSLEDLESSGGSYDRIAQLLIAEVDPARVSSNPWSSMDSSPADFFTSFLSFGADFGALEKSGLESLLAVESPGPSVRYLRSQLHEAAARDDLVFRDLEGARERAARAVAELEVIGETDLEAQPEEWLTRHRFFRREGYERRFAVDLAGGRALQATIELAAGELPRAQEFLANLPDGARDALVANQVQLVADYRGGGDPGALLQTIHFAEGAENGAIRTLLAGDGSALIDGDHSLLTIWGSRLLRLWLPGLRVGRSDVLNRLRWSIRFAVCARCAQGDLMLKLAWLQELAVAADADDDSQLLGRALEAHARGFTEREFALPIRALQAM